MQLKLLSLGFHHKAHLHSTANKAAVWAQIAKELSSMPEFAEYTPVGTQQIGLKFKEIVEKVNSALESGNDWESGRAHADEVKEMVALIVEEIQAEKELRIVSTPSVSNSHLDKIGDDILAKSFERGRKRQSSEPSLSPSHSSSSPSPSSSSSNSPPILPSYLSPCIYPDPKHTTKKARMQHKQIPFEERALEFLRESRPPLIHHDIEAEKPKLLLAFEAIQSLLQQGLLTTEGAATAVDLLSDTLTIDKVATMPESLLRIWFLSKNIR